MRLRINQLKAQWADQGKRVTLDDIAAGTGINRRTLDNIIAGRYNEIRGDYIDALCAYFHVEAGNLVQAEPVTIPLSISIRPDRHGKRVGEAGDES